MRRACVAIVVLLSVALLSCGGEGFALAGAGPSPGRVGLMVLQDGLQVEVTVIDGAWRQVLVVGPARDGYVRTSRAVLEPTIELRPRLAGGLAVVGGPDPIVRKVATSGDVLLGVAVLRRADAGQAVVVEDGDLVLVELDR